MCLTQNIFKCCCLPDLDWNLPLPPMLTLWVQPDWGALRGLCLANLEEGGGQSFPQPPLKP